MFHHMNHKYNNLNPTFAVYKKLRFKMARKLLQLNFLVACKNNNVVPKFLQIKKQIFPKGMNVIIQKAQEKMLKSTIRNLRKEIYWIEVNCYYMFQDLNEQLDHIIFNQLLLKLYDQIELLKEKTRRTHHKKLQSLKEACIQKKKTGTERIIPTPFVNLTNHQFTQSEIDIISKGPNYAVPAKINVSNTIPNVENVIHIFPKENHNEMRNRFAYAINKHNNFINNQINNNSKYFKILKQLKNNSNIRFIKADKTNQLVAIDQTAFQTKFNDLITDLKCTVLNSDPTEKFVTKIQNFARDSQKTDPPAPFKFKVPFYPAAPKLFVKIKTHKPNNPLRPIVAKYSSPTFILEEKLSKFLAPLIDSYKYNVKSALELIKQTKNLVIPKKAILASFDVKSLYPSIPTNRALELIMKLTENFPLINPHRKFIAKSLKIIFSANYFVFDSIVYFQGDGSPMGSAISLTLSEVIMQEVERQALNISPWTPLFFRRYIDDYFIIWDYSQQDLMSFLANLNSIFPTINLTFELELNKSIAFLDLRITRGYNDKLFYDIYRKPSNIPLPIRADSNHPAPSKKSFFRAYINRAYTHTTFKFQENKELNRIRKIAVNAGYSIGWINSLIKNTLSPPNKVISHLVPTAKSKPATCKYTPAIPFSEHFYNLQKYAQRKFNIVIPFAKPVDTAKFIVYDRDHFSSSGGVYRIDFKNNTTNDIKTYIGQTCRKLNARINEHVKGEENKYCGTVVKKFMKQNPEYIPDWENVKIIASPRNHYSLLLREAIEIFHNRDTCINGKDGTLINDIWLGLLGS